MVRTRGATEPETAESSKAAGSRGSKKVSRPGDDIDQGSDYEAEIPDEYEQRVLDEQARDDHNRHNPFETPSTGLLTSDRLADFEEGVRGTPRHPYRPPANFSNMQEALPATAQASLNPTAETRPGPILGATMQVVSKQSSGIRT